MMKSNNSRSIWAAILAFGMFMSALVLGVTPSYAYAGTLENGNLAYAQSEFNKGSACDYLPGYETGYDAWHLVLTSRGATFMADPTNPKVAINLNINFMRQDGTKFVIKSGALVQFGKGAYVYTLTKDRIRIVQAGSLATINSLDSGMRLSHTCPGSGEATLVPTIAPSPTPTPTPTPTLSATTASPTPTPTTKFAGTLENGNLALADSEFNKGADCDYLPGYETGYDAWHLVLTTRGATFIQDPKDPKVSIDLNILFQRQDGSRYVITKGAWVQFGKGAYVYTPTAAKDKIVQAGTFAATNTISSGMRLSHTCPGSGTTGTTVTPTPTPSPTPAPSISPSASPTPSATSTPTPTPSATPTPTPSVTPKPSATPTPSPSVAPTPTPTPSPTQSISNCKLCIIKSYAKVTPRPSESPGPGYKNLEPSPSPTPTQSPSPKPTTSPNPSPTPTAPTTSPSPSPSPTQSTSPTPRPTTSPTTPPSAPIVPPVVEDPKNVVFVKPDEPKVIVLPELKDIPAENIKVTEEPKYGTVEVNPDSTLTYVSNLTDPTSTVVDKFEITYTDLSGAVIVANREVVLAQDGDVPSIIQTGLAGNGSMNTLIFALLISVLTGLVISRRRIANGKKSVAAAATALMAFSLVVVPVAQPGAEAACKPVKPTGKTIGRIKVGNVDMPIKSFTYPAGGVMEPQNSTLMAGLSARHMPLSSDLGTSVLTWHKDYNGCVNKLNIMFDRKVGSTFEITDENGNLQRYRVTKKLEVRKGDYKKSWFTLVGPRQLSMFTCTGRFSNGHYEKNLVVIATKIS